MADMTEQAAKATLTPIVNQHGAEAVDAYASGRMVDIPGSAQRSIDRVARSFSDDRIADMAAEIQDRQEAMGGLEPDVQVEEQQTIGTDDRAGAFQRRSERSRQRREQQRGAEREQGQMDLGTSAGTQRLGEFEDVDDDQDGGRDRERGPDPDDPTRIRGREPDQGPDAFFDEDEQERIRHHARKMMGEGVGPFGNFLRSVGVTGRMNQVREFRDAGIEDPEDFVAHFERRGDFTAVDGVGAKSSEKLESAIPIIREALALGPPGDRITVEGDTFEEEMRNQFSGASEEAKRAIIDRWGDEFSGFVGWARETYPADVLALRGVDRGDVEAVIGSQSDPNSTRFTVLELYERKNAPSTPDEPVYQEGDRVEHRDGRTGTVTRSDPAKPPGVEWDNGTEQVVSPSALTTVDNGREGEGAGCADLQDDLLAAARRAGTQSEQTPSVESVADLADEAAAAGCITSDDRDEIVSWYESVEDRPGTANSIYNQTVRQAFRGGGGNGGNGGGGPGGGGEREIECPECGTFTTIDEETARLGGFIECPICAEDIDIDAALEGGDQDDQQEALDALAAGAWDPETIATAFDVSRNVAEAVEQMGDDVSHVLKVQDNTGDLSEWPGIGEASARSIKGAIPELEARSVTKYALPLSADDDSQGANDGV